LKPNRVRKQDLSEGERERELPQVAAQPNPIGFLPSVIIEEESGEIFVLLRGKSQRDSGLRGGCCSNRKEKISEKLVRSKVFTNRQLGLISTS